MEWNDLAVQRKIEVEFDARRTIKIDIKSKSKDAEEVHRRQTHYTFSVVSFFFFFTLKQSLPSENASAANKINEAIISLYIFRHFRFVFCIVSLCETM